MLHTVTDGPVTFVALQRRARRRSAVLIIGTFTLLWLAVNLVTSPAHLRTEACADPTGELCETTFQPHLGVLIGTTLAVAAYLVVAHLFAGRAALALAGARRADGPEHRQLRNLVEELSIASGVTPPQVWVIDDPSPNAFATGRDERHAAVVFTTGLMATMSRRELSGVVAHELAHIRNRDIAITTLAVLTTATIAVLADVALRIAYLAGSSMRRSSRNSAGVGIAGAALAIALILYVVAVPAGLLLRAALSRQRETLADASAVQYTRDPSGLRSALEKLEADPTVPSRVSTATAHLWIEEPKPARRPQRALLGGWMDTHPPIADRIAILRRMEGIDPASRGPNDPIPGRVSTPAAGPAPGRGPGAGPGAGPAAPWAPPAPPR